MVPQAQVMPRERQPCVYILSSQPRGTLYVGVTSDLMARLWKHREEPLVGFTKRHVIKRLV
jgi:putative endonuclease